MDGRDTAANDDAKPARRGTPIVSPKGYQIIGADAAEERFGLLADVHRPHHRHTQPIRLYGGSLHVRGDLIARHRDQRCADNVIVDGDLVIDGGLDWWEDGHHKFLLVTGDLRADSVHIGERVDLVVRGDVLVNDRLAARSTGEGPLDGDATLSGRNVRARHVSLFGHVDLVVRGDLNAPDGILGRDMDDRGSLTVAGCTRAGVLVTTDAFTVKLDGPQELGRRAVVDLRDRDELAELFRPELFRPEQLGEDDDPLGWEVGDRIDDALAAGRPVLRDSPGPRLAASLTEVERLQTRAAQVTNLDLAEHRVLRENPERVLAFTALRRLRLTGAWEPDRVLERLGELPHLEELDISAMSLVELPAAIGLLRELRVLDISDNPLRGLPDRLGDLANLRTLHARGLSCPLPDALSRLPALEELDLSWLQPSPADRREDDHRLVRFPRIVTRMPALRILDLSTAVLDEVPDELLRATALEELRLDSALGRVERLPDLSRLPRLRVLTMNGNAGNAGRRPLPHLLDAVWAVSTLEELGLDSWGERTRYNTRTGRHEAVPPLILPDDAFARLSRLRVLDLKFTNLTTLPESFYALTALEDVNVDFGSLDSSTRQRLATLARTEPDNPARDWIRALQAKVLLKAGRIDDAYEMARRILTRRPDFRGLAAIATSADYRTRRGDTS